MILEPARSVTALASKNMWQVILDSMSTREYILSWNWPNTREATYAKNQLLRHSIGLGSNSEIKKWITEGPMDLCHAYMFGPKSYQITRKALLTSLERLGAAFSGLESPIRCTSLALSQLGEAMQREDVAEDADQPD